jgi:hypothetical protein
MPKHVRTIELYTCDYKCGRKATQKYTTIDHEKKCYCNPENKACRVCANCSFVNRFLVCDINGWQYKVEKKKPTSDSKVYDKDMNVIWEIKKFPEVPIYDWDLWLDIDNHNRNRIFPTKNCEKFKLGKKVY